MSDLRFHEENGDAYSSFKHENEFRPISEVADKPVTYDPASFN